MYNIYTTHPQYIDHTYLIYSYSYVMLSLISTIALSTDQHE